MIPLIPPTPNDCAVCPPSRLLELPVDFSTGGKFLREIDRFFEGYEQGTQVLGQIDRTAPIRLYNEL